MLTCAYESKAAKGCVRYSYSLLVFLVLWLAGTLVVPLVDGVARAYQVAVCPEFEWFSLWGVAKALAWLGAIGLTTSVFVPSPRFKIALAVCGACCIMGFWLYFFYPARHQVLMMRDSLPVFISLVLVFMELCRQTSVVREGKQGEGGKGDNPH